MNKLKNTESIIVFTHSSTKDLIKFNGSQEWVLNKKRAIKCEYIICVQNQNPNFDWVWNNEENDIEHGTGFLIGKISRINDALWSTSENKSIIEFSEYAHITVKNFWEGWKNPVIYKKTSEININFNSLNFKKVPPRDNAYIQEYMDLENSRTSEINNKDNGLSIEEAKAGLSKRYGTSAENIKIIMEY